MDRGDEDPEWRGITAQALDATIDRFDIPCVRTACVTALFLALAACSSIVEPRAIDTTISLMKRSKAAMQQESDVELARAATPSGIKTLEGFHVAYPHHRDLIELLSEAICQYGVGFLQDDWEAAVSRGDRDTADHVRTRARGILGRCVNYGLMLLGPEWSRALWSRDASLAGVIARATHRDRAGMFWVALGLGGVIGMYPEDLTLMAYLPHVQAMLERVIELDERFQDGLAHVTLGIMYSAQSAAVGGDPERGRAHFERARAITSGRSLMVDVLYARYYAVTTRDRALFRGTLVRVLRTSPAIWPENRLANEMAHRKARRYLASERTWF